LQKYAKEVTTAGLRVTTKGNSAEVDDCGGESIERTNERLLELLKDLCDGLWERVYPKESKDVIGETRVVLDLKQLALKMRDDGISQVNLFYLFFPKFKGAINNIPIQTIKIVSEDELKFQYRLFSEKAF
jgi:hypothetical protein